MSAIDANIAGVAMSAKPAASYMRKQGSGRSIVLVASGIVCEPGAKMTQYAASKLPVGTWKVTRMLGSLRQSLINEGTTISAVTPGVTSIQLVNYLKPAFAAKNESMGSPRHRVLSCC